MSSLRSRVICLRMVLGITVIHISISITVDDSLRSAWSARRSRLPSVGSAWDDDSLRSAFVCWRAAALESNEVLANDSYRRGAGIPPIFWQPGPLNMARTMPNKKIKIGIANVSHKASRHFY